jgi:hypothetical protein
MKKRNFFIPLPFLLLFACSPDPLQVDLDTVELEPLHVLRLEEDLFSLNATNFETESEKIKNKYGSFYEHFLINPLRLNGSKDTLYKAMVLDFVKDQNVREAYDYVHKLYPASKFDALAAEVNNCAKRFKYHFPKRKLPSRLITCTTGWNYAFAYMDGALIIGLDMYLGDTAKFYQMLRYPQYQARKMNEQHILPDIARGWMLTEFDNDLAENTLLSHTIFYGKLFYAINALLPETADSLLIGYTSKQMKTSKEYEKNYWSYFAEKNRLYENNLNTIRELTSEGPFTAAISKECPPRIAMWIGWQIVKSYMKNNKDVTLDELINDNNAQKILSKSKYRP